MRGSELRKALHKGDRVYGIGLEGYVQPRWSRFFANSGLDFVFMDSEHSPLDRMQQAWAAQTYAAYNIAPLLRIPEISASLATRALDAGAHGIIVPYIETDAQVKELVGAVRYRPFRGHQLDEVLKGESLPSEETGKYLEAVNHDNLLIIMIESQAGLENLDSLLQVQGVDAVLVGPNDLSISLGVPDQITHPTFEQAVRQIIQTCQHYDVGVGIHFPGPDITVEKQWIDWGCNLIVHLTDTLMIARGIEGDLQLLRDHTGDTLEGKVTDQRHASSGHSM